MISDPEIVVYIAKSYSDTKSKGLLLLMFSVIMSFLGGIKIWMPWVTDLSFLNNLGLNHGLVVP